MKKRINWPFGAAALTLALLTSTQDTLGEAFTIDAGAEDVLQAHCGAD